MRGQVRTVYQTVYGPDDVPDERKLEDAERKSCVRHVGLPLQSWLSVRITCARIPQAAIHANQADREHRHEDQIHADERSPEMNLAERLVQRTAANCGPPVINAREQREHGAG